MGLFAFPWVWVGLSMAWAGGSFPRETTSHGLKIVSSERVSLRAHAAMASLLDGMASARPDLFAKLAAEPRFRIVIKRIDETWFRFPEYALIYDWIRKVGEARIRGGIGPTDEVPYATVTEDNLVALPGDPYFEESVALHEFSHSLAWRPTLPDFEPRLASAYADALKNQRWAGTYAASNGGEYWAEGVQGYFDSNTYRAVSDGIHGPNSTREKVCAHDPPLCHLLDDVFRRPSWRFSREIAIQSAKPSGP